MLQSLKSFLLGTEYVRNRSETARQNRLAIHYLAMGGLPVGLVNIASQSVVKGGISAPGRDALLLVYFCLLIVLDRMLAQDFRYTTFLTYVIEAPILLLSILLGTVWDPSHQAVTFLMFLVIMPVFILDRPLRLIGVSTLWTALFVAMCLHYKDPAIVMPDLIHTIEFLLASISVTFVVLRLRFEVMGNLSQTRYHLVHDDITATYNRTGFDEHVGLYLGKPLFVAMGDVDHLSLINDFYGNETGNTVLRAFADALKAHFGQDHTYRLGGSGILCIGRNMDEDHGTERLELSRKSLTGIDFPEVHTGITYSFGYVCGTPTTEQELQDIVQLANIYVHKARRQGEGTSVGGDFGPDALKEGIAEATLTGHARAYEINQLTGFPSMAYFINRVEELLSTADFGDLSVVIGYLNIVDFRDFNDRNGYAKGDDLLRTLAELLREALPQRHISYLTGSRFAVFCYRDEVPALMEHLAQGMEAHLPDRPPQLNAGFAEHHKGDSVISLIDQAKLAHDHAAPDDPSGYRFYNADLDREIRLRHHLVSHIDKAVDLRWLLVHYQPIMDSRTGKIANFEALSRWNDPIYGLLPPYQFIGALEDENLVYKLSLSVVRQVLRDLHAMQGQGLPLVPVSVNLSRKDFFVCDMVEEITALVDASGLPRSVLAIEITESAFAKSTDLIKREVARLRERGFAVWMDDFGSEYSSLNLLEELDFDLVKVDMRFMRNFHAQSKSARIVAAIISMCRDLHMQTLVEGVEEDEQRATLREMGVDKLQGYLFSPPRALPDVLSLAQASGWL